MFNTCEESAATVLHSSLNNGLKYLKVYAK